MDLSVTNDAAEKGVWNAQEAALSSKSESRRECNIKVGKLPALAGIPAKS